MTENVGRYRPSNQLKTAKKSKAKQILRRTDDKQIEAIDKEYSLIKSMKNRTQRREGVLEKRRHCYEY